MRIATLEGQQNELATALEDPAAYESGGNAVVITNRCTDLSCFSLLILPVLVS
ncbi:MAG TPA: hypothetical protein VGQ82_10095 [Chthoniobacterales bacterium]|nr:hypothetical protein [Chthoniobacterales bacterium]